MERLNKDLIQEICNKLPVMKIVLLCSTARHIHTFQHELLHERDSEVETEKNKSMLCRICNKRIYGRKLYIMIVCTCLFANNYQYYHSTCMNVTPKHKGYTFYKCPECGKRKPLIVCDCSS